MDDTRKPVLHRSPRRAPPFLIAALTLGGFAWLAVWPPVVHGLSRGPRLALLALLLGGTLAWLMGQLGPAGGAASARTSRRRGRAARSAEGLVSVAEAAISPAWLQVVSGAGAEPLALGILELADALVGRGQRVLLVDGARRLRLHDRLDREGSPGLLECLLEQLPLVECIQGGGGERLSFLPRGNPMRHEAWPHLGHLLRESRTHFDRVLLALDFAAPHEVGEGLAGLEVAGWWAPDESSPALATALAERIGIHLRSLRLTADREVLHEPRPRSVMAPPTRPLALTAGRPTGARGGGGPGARPRGESGVVDCDLHVRERLRFLLWMRGLQAVSPRELEVSN
jgi:hypothetical protein